ncbi:MAG TPA: nucleotidyltransferase domain-containing protein [Micromonosporaceae bacterium]|nr:nucleotidyltransferase domain-containing protein [Micromonosporaceae bacterium]
MKRQRATHLAEQLLERLAAGHEEWPLSLITEVYVFGSYARGAAEPHDLDVDVEINRQDERWISHFVTCLSGGRDPYSLIRRALVGASRSYQFLFEARDRVDFPLTLLWRPSDPLAAALARLHEIAEDDTAGRAARDAMLPQFDGLDRWIPRRYRERLVGAVDGGAVSVERLELPDAPLEDSSAQRHLEERWEPTSPLYRAGRAVLAHFEERGVDLSQVHLHGRDVGGPETPYFAGFQMRYFRSVPYCLTEYHGVEWIEVVHPTRTLPNSALRIVPTRSDLLVDADWT